MSKVYVTYYAKAMWKDYGKGISYLCKPMPRECQKIMSRQCQGVVQYSLIIHYNARYNYYVLHSFD